MPTGCLLPYRRWAPICSLANPLFVNALGLSYFQHAGSRSQRPNTLIALGLFLRLTIASLVNAVSYGYHHDERDNNLLVTESVNAATVGFITAPLIPGLTSLAGTPFANLLVAARANISVLNSLLIVTDRLQPVFRS